jgi:hypothetical protein
VGPLTFHNPTGPHGLLRGLLHIHSMVRVAQNRPTLLFHLRLPQPGGSGSRIYIPHEQGGPIIPPDTGLWVHYSPVFRNQQWRKYNRFCFQDNVVKGSIVVYQRVCESLAVHIFCILVVILSFRLTYVGYSWPYRELITVGNHFTELSLFTRLWETCWNVINSYIRKAAVYLQQ